MKAQTRPKVCSINQTLRSASDSSFLCKCCRDARLRSSFTIMVHAHAVNSSSVSKRAFSVLRYRWSDSRSISRRAAVIKATAALSFTFFNGGSAEEPALPDQGRLPDWEEAAGELLDWEEVAGDPAALRPRAGGTGEEATAIWRANFGAMTESNFKHNSIASQLHTLMSH